MRALMIALLLLSACGTNAVTLVHPDGRTAQCGPYSTTRGADVMGAALHEMQCLQDYKEQGYVRE